MFIDIIHFLNNSLNNLVENSGENDFYHLNHLILSTVLDLLKKKRFFPYDYWGSFEKFKEGLPSKDKFYNTSTNCAINDKNYEHVLNICKAFTINNIKDYHDLYLKVDVLLLACVFETFRKESINSFELNPYCYLTTTGYSWCAVLRFICVSLKLISDIEITQLSFL